MNIVVCVKYVPDATADRSFDSSDSTVDREGVDGLLSELDEYAVEQALLAAEESDGEVTVLTVGPADAADAVRKALQMGADKGVHVEDDDIAGSDAAATSLEQAATRANLQVIKSPKFTRVVVPARAVSAAGVSTSRSARSRPCRRLPPSFAPRSSSAGARAPSPQWCGFARALAS